MQYGRCARPLSSPHNTFALNLNLELGDYWMAVYRYDLQLGPIHVSLSAILGRSWTQNLVIELRASR